MKIFRCHLIKRIFIFFCCTTLIFSNIFIFYGTTVYAVEYDDLLRDGVQVACSAAGIYFSGGSLTPIMLIPFIERLAGTGFDVYDYITENEDGTTTISEEFINLVLQAYKECVGGSFSGNLEQNENLYYVYGETEFVVDRFNNGRYVSIVEGFTYAYPVAFLFANGDELVKYSYWGKPAFDTIKSSGYGLIPFFYNGNPDSANGGINLVNDYLSLVGDPKPQPFVNIYKNGEKDSASNQLNVYGIFGDPGGVSASASSSSIPIYTNFDLMVSDLQSGKYTHADNLSSGVNFGQTSSYTGTYGGGDIKVTTEKLNGIEDKLNEINETDKSIDDKLKDLLEWLGIGDGTGGGGTGGSWYDKILDYLDKILKQLKSIKHWTIVDTVIDGVDAIADWLDLIHDLLSDVDDGAESVVSTLSSALNDSMGLMKKKFPFSIPWDILFFVTALSAEPEVPQFSIPFDFEISALDLEVHYDLELDFTPFQWLSDLSRLLLSMTYAVGLMKLTFNVSTVEKEG